MSGFADPNSTALPGINCLTELQQLMVEGYAISGDLRKTAKEVGCPLAEAIQMSQKLWWQQELQAHRRLKNAEMDAHMTTLLGKTLDALDDRLTHGDVDGLDEDGEVRRVPIPARNLPTILTALFDRRQLLRELPTNIGGEGGGGKLKQLAEKLDELGRMLNAKTIEAPQEIEDAREIGSEVSGDISRRER